MQHNSDNNNFSEDENTHRNDDDDNNDESSEIGSDDLLADDALRLPESANILVRLHAVRAWLTRRRQEANIAIGDAALALQEAFQEPPQQMSRPRRRERGDAGNSMLRLQRAQQAVTMAQQRLAVYEEAQALLEETVSHVTAGERILVEYYLAIEALLEASLQHSEAHEEMDVVQEVQEIRQEVLADVLHRIEHVGIPDEEE